MKGQTESAQNLRFIKDLSLIAISNELSVSLYEVKTRKLLKNWVFKQGSKCTSSVSYSKSNEKFLLVQNKKVVRIWEMNDANINICTKIKFSKPIHCILCTEESSFIVFDCGSIQTILKENTEHQSFDINSEGFLKSSDKIMWCDICWSTGVVFILFVTCDEKTGKVSLHSVKCCKDNSTEYNSVFLNANNGRFYSYCIIQGDQSVFVYLDAERNIFKYQMENLSDPVLCGKIDNILSVNSSIAAINEHYLLIAGLKDSSNQEHCLIWNLTFGIECARQVLPSKLEKVRLHIAEEYVFIKCADGIIGFEYQAESSTLANFVGKKSCIQPENFPMISWDESNSVSVLWQFLDNSPA
ncbi:Nucleolar protein 11 [Nymphon striatum]|nr:Nucleolar protein 11 [Nymphon striatum]KAG1666320.1 Nucleolar protein 11 [Nymphon striatum]KAG1669710.1 Nucleolar protein 11 [Nymphon striatum]